MHIYLYTDAKTERTECIMDGRQSSQAYAPRHAFMHIKCVKRKNGTSSDKPPNRERTPFHTQQQQQQKSTKKSSNDIRNTYIIIKTMWK